MSRLEELDLGVQLALIDHFDISDTDAERLFGNSVAELQTARELVAVGTITIATDVDFEEYGNIITLTPPVVEKEEVPKEVERPVTASKPQPKTKKRGRRGNKIANAFAAIPSDPTDAETFIAEHNISLAVLRQAKRFDKSGVPGRVRVRKSKETGTLTVWREPPKTD